MVQTLMTVTQMFPVQAPCPDTVYQNELTNTNTNPIIHQMMMRNTHVKMTKDDTNEIPSNSDPTTTQVDNDNDVTVATHHLPNSKRGLQLTQFPNNSHNLHNKNSKNNHHTTPNKAPKTNAHFVTMHSPPLTNAWI